MATDTTVQETVDYIRRSSPYWAPELRIPKLFDIVGPFRTETQDAIIEALKALPESERLACGVDLLSKE